MAMTVELFRRSQAERRVTTILKSHLTKTNQQSDEPERSQEFGSPADGSLSDSSDEISKSFNYSEIIRCQICGDKASGMHYGVYSCEGCKGFFRRTQRMKLDYKFCPFWQTKPCDITIKSRNKCQYCRFQKCLSLGMSIGAVRMGRVPRAEKQKLLHEMELIKDSPILHILQETEEEKNHRLFVDRIYEHWEALFEAPKTQREIDAFRKYTNAQMNVNFPTDLVFTVKPMGISPEQLAGVPRELTNPFHIARHFSCASEIGIHKNANFLKKIPEFRSLSAEDQLILFKESCFEIALTLNAERYHMDVIEFPEDNTFLQVKKMSDMFSRMDIQNPKVKYFMRFNALKLKGREIALFTLLILAAPDRENLTNVGAVEEFQHRLVKALETELNKTHPNTKNILANTLNLLTVLRDVMPEHITKLNAIISMFDGKLPVEPSPLMKEVYRLT